MVLDMPAFRGKYDASSTVAKCRTATKPLTNAVDAMLVKAMEDKEHFPDANRFREALQAQKFAEVAKELARLVQNERLSEYERATLERMVTYYAQESDAERVGFLSGNKLGIQALRFALAPQAVKRPLETGNSLEFDMRGSVSTDGKVEAAEIKSSYAHEAAAQVALRARALGWCVENMELVRRPNIKLSGVVYILRRTENNKRLARGAETVPPCTVNDVVVSVQYV